MLNPGRLCLVLIAMAGMPGTAFMLVDVFLHGWIPGNGVGGVVIGSVCGTFLLSLVSTGRLVAIMAAGERGGIPYFDAAATLAFRQFLEPAGRDALRMDDFGGP